MIAQVWIRFCIFCSSESETFMKFMELIKVIPRYTVMKDNFHLSKEEELLTTESPKDQTRRAELSISRNLPNILTANTSNHNPLNIFFKKISDNIENNTINSCITLLKQKPRVTHATNAALKLI